MRTLAVLGSVAVLGLAVAGSARARRRSRVLTGKCAKANLDLVLRRQADARDRQPLLPAVVGRQGRTRL